MLFADGTVGISGGPKVGGRLDFAGVSRGAQAGVQGRGDFKFDKLTVRFDDPNLDGDDRFRPLFSDAERNLFAASGTVSGGVSPVAYAEAGYVVDTKRVEKTLLSFDLGTPIDFSRYNTANPFRPASVRPSPYVDEVVDLPALVPNPVNGTAPAEVYAYTLGNEIRVMVGSTDLGAGVLVKSIPWVQPDRTISRVTGSWQLGGSSATSYAVGNGSQYGSVVRRERVVGAYTAAGYTTDTRAFNVTLAQGVGSVVVRAGGGDNTFRVNGVPALDVQLVGGPNQDAVLLTDRSAPNGATLGVTGGGGFDTVTVDDTAVRDSTTWYNTVTHTLGYALTNTFWGTSLLTRTDRTVTATYYGELGRYHTTPLVSDWTATAAVTPAGVEGVLVRGAAGSRNVTSMDGNTAANVTLVGGDLNDTITVTAPPPAAGFARGSLTVEGGLGTDAVAVAGTLEYPRLSVWGGRYGAAGENDSLMLDDGGSRAGRRYVVGVGSGTMLTRDGMLTLDGRVASLDVRGGSGNDRFDLTPDLVTWPGTPQRTVSVSGGAGDDSFAMGGYDNGPARGRREGGRVRPDVADDADRHPADAGPPDRRVQLVPGVRAAAGVSGSVGGVRVVVEAEGRGDPGDGPGQPHPGRLRGLAGVGGDLGPPLAGGPAAGDLLLGRGQPVHQGGEQFLRRGDGGRPGRRSWPGPTGTRPSSRTGGGGSSRRAAPGRRPGRPARTGGRARPRRPRPRPGPGPSARRTSARRPRHAPVSAGGRRPGRARLNDSDPCRHRRAVPAVVHTRGGVVRSLRERPGAPPLAEQRTTPTGQPDHHRRPPTPGRRDDATRTATAAAGPDADSLLLESLCLRWEDARRAGRAVCRPCTPPGTPP